jgi:hypothetical protein
MAPSLELSIMVVRQIAGRGAGILGRGRGGEEGGIMQPLMLHNCIRVTVQMQGG